MKHTSKMAKENLKDLVDKMLSAIAFYAMDDKELTKLEMQYDLCIENEVSDEIWKKLIKKIYEYGENNENPSIVCQTEWWYQYYEEMYLKRYKWWRIVFEVLYFLCIPITGAITLAIVKLCSKYVKIDAGSQITIILIISAIASPFDDLYLCRRNCIASA